MLLRAGRQRQTDKRGIEVLPNAAVVYSVQQHAEETFNFLRSDERLSLPSSNVVVALSSVGQLLGLVEADIERLLKLDQKGRSLDVTGMSYSEFCHSVRCCAVLHGHLALEALPALKVPDLSHALYKTYMAYCRALRPHPSGKQCVCRLVAGEPPPRLFRESFLRLCRDAGFVAPEGPMAPPTMERIWSASSSLCTQGLPPHMCFGQFLRSLAVLSGQLKAEVFVPVVALGLAEELPPLQLVPNNYRFKHYKEVPLNLGGDWALPHLTIEALSTAVQEGRQYEYEHVIAAAQRVLAEEEEQRRQWRRHRPISAAVPNSAAALGAAASSAARMRPWSAGGALAVLSPHTPRSNKSVSFRDVDGRAGDTVPGEVSAPGGGTSIHPGWAGSSSWHPDRLGNTEPGISPTAADTAVPPRTARAWDHSRRSLSCNTNSGSVPVPRIVTRTYSAGRVSFTNDNSDPSSPASLSSWAHGFGASGSRLGTRPQTASSSSSSSRGPSPNRSVREPVRDITSQDGGSKAVDPPHPATIPEGSLMPEEVEEGQGVSDSGPPAPSRRGAKQPTTDPWVADEVRGSMEERLRHLEDQGRVMMGLLAQLQTQVSKLRVPGLVGEEFGQQEVRGPPPMLVAAAVSSPQRVGEVGGVLEVAGGAAAAGAGNWGGGRSPMEYKLAVHTSDVEGAGAAAAVSVTLYGEGGDTGEHLLEWRPNSLGRGQTSIFALTGPDVGHLKRLRVRTGPGGRWHLQAIDVVSAATQTQYIFPLNGWLDDNSVLEQVLDCAASQPLSLPTTPSSPIRTGLGGVTNSPQLASQTSYSFTNSTDDPGSYSSPQSSPPPSSDARCLSCQSVSSFASVGPGVGTPPATPVRQAGTPAGRDAGGAGSQSAAVAAALGVLQKRLEQVEEAQGEMGVRAGAAAAAAVLMRVPGRVLSSVQRGREGSMAAAVQGDGAAASVAVSGAEASEDSALGLLADLLAQLHARGEQAAAAAAAAGAQAAAALEATRQQNSRMAQLQFEVSAISRAADAAEKRSLQTAAGVASAVQQAVQNEFASGTVAVQSGVGQQGGKDPTSSASSEEARGSSVEALAQDVRECKEVVETLSGDVRRLAKESSRLRSMGADAESLMKELRGFQSQLAGSLLEATAVLASLRSGVGGMSRKQLRFADPPQVGPPSREGGGGGVMKNGSAIQRSGSLGDARVGGSLLSSRGNGGGLDVVGRLGGAGVGGGGLLGGAATGVGRGEGGGGKGGGFPLGQALHVFRSELMELGQVVRSEPGGVGSDVRSRSSSPGA